MAPLKAKYTKLAAITALVVITDQVTKALVLHHFPLHHAVVVIDGLFNLIHVQNPGGAFGFLADQGVWVQRAVFIVASLAALGLIGYLYHQAPATHALMATGLGLVFAGAIGNLIDRVRFGHVIDFLDVYVGNWHWPAFNVADSAITVGMAIFIYHLAFNKLPE